ncbi:MAG: DUF1343 domain-containing protein [Caldilineaceae bacterium]|nr:DUF1343 domain-containing protein [Caldilineaceae bacterium]
MLQMFGVDQLLTTNQNALAGRRIGLVTNNAATTSPQSGMKPSRWALQQAGFNLTALFSPEHGLGAGAADGAEVRHGTDRLTGLPIYSLYGATFRPTPEMLADIDLLLFDIPDVGARFYTYIWTLSHVMEACAETGTPLWVLDRPNPLGGLIDMAEGPMLDEQNISTFVGRWSMPVRHSLTAGELAVLWNQERNLHVDLNVIKSAGWSRRQHWPDTRLPFVPASPAMPSYDAVLVYPGTCFFEGTNVSEGRGTSNPFQQIGAPWVDGNALADAFNAWALAGVFARAVEFIPAASKHAGQVCQGVMLHVDDASIYHPVAAGLHLLLSVMRNHPAEFGWLPYPTAANGPGFGHFDRLVGQLSVRQELVKQIDLTAAQNRRQIQQWTQAAGWSERTESILLYD